MTRVRNTQVMAHFGYVTDLFVDAIVSGANPYLDMDRGIALIIKQKGGKKIEDEAKDRAPIDPGNVIVTKAGSLNAKYVIHAVAVDSDLIATEDTIKEATENSLLSAEELKLKSIAFPALGTVIGGVPINRAAKVMVGKVKEHSSEQTNIEVITFAVCNREAYSVLKKEIENR
ncbi:MAG: macro domain-containing protein [Halobacteriota archaeon]|nr:macro domain-containing protein [Halobacteriota archaeon]